MESVGLGLHRGAVRRLLLVAWTTNRFSVVVLRVGLNLLGVVLLLESLATEVSIPGFDSVSYWLIEPSDLYRWTDSSIVAGPFRYSPVLGQLLDPLGSLSWHVFFVLFLVASLLALVALGGRWGLALLLIPSVLGEVYLGNIDLFMALSVGFGLVWPPAWAALLLTKGTPAVVLLWFVVRGEWRSLGVVLGLAALVAIPSVLLTPDLWATWVRVSSQFAGSIYGASTIPVLPRLVAAAVLVSIGARRGWKWTVALAAVLAMPGLDWKTMTIGLAILPLYGLGFRADWISNRRRGQRLQSA